MCPFCGASFPLNTSSGLGQAMIATRGYALREVLPTFVQGQADPYDMFASSSVDEGEPEEREFVDTTGGQQNLPRAGEGPRKVFRIEDDPTLTGLGQTSVATVTSSSVQPSWRRWAGVFAMGVVGGAVGALIASRCCNKTA